MQTTGGENYQSYYHQIFHLKQDSGGLGNWKIHSRACTGKVLKISGVGCGALNEIQVYDAGFLRDPI